MKFFWDLDLPSRRYKKDIKGVIICNCDKEKIVIANEVKQYKLNEINKIIKIIF